MTEAATAQRLRQKRTYGALSRLTLRSALKRELLTNFGFENMAIVADLLIDRFLAIVQEYQRPQEQLGPYQMLVVGIDKNRSFPYAQPCERRILQPVVLTLWTQEELEALGQGATVCELRPARLVRLLKEAYAQGAVLSLTMLALLCGVSDGQISHALRQYREQHPGATVPYLGTVFDTGPSVTHKAQILRLMYQGLLTKEIAARTAHSPRAVDAYIADHRRVVAAHEAGHRFEEIHLITGLPASVVRQHLHIYQEATDSRKSQKPKTRQGQPRRAGLGGR